MKKGMYKFLVILSCLTLCMSFFVVPVNAEDSIYYPDPSSYSAYDYFFSKGYNHLMLSSTNNVTYNVILDNVGTNNGSITGTDGLSGSSHTTGTINSNGSSTLGSKYMFCDGNTAGTSYTCTFSNRSSGISNSQSINIGFNENTYDNYNDVDININETINQRINTDITGSITAAEGSYDYAYLPWLNGTYNHSTGVSSTDYFYLNEENDLYLIFLCQIYSNTAPLVYTHNGRTVLRDFTVETITNNMRLYNYHFYLPSNVEQEWFTLDLPWLNNSKVIPIYLGSSKRLTDDIREFVGMPTKTNILLDKGNNDTSASNTAGQNANNQVKGKITEFDNIENNSVNDMNSQISNLDLTSDILSNSKFLSSAVWVKQQFDRMTVSTPIGSVLSFSLILGMSLIFLGKIR